MRLEAPTGVPVACLIIPRYHNLIRANLLALVNSFYQVYQYFDNREKIYLTANGICSSDCIVIVAFVFSIIKQTLCFTTIKSLYKRCYNSTTLNWLLLLYCFSNYYAIQTKLLMSLCSNKPNTNPNLNVCQSLAKCKDIPRKFWTVLCIQLNVAESNCAWALAYCVSILFEIAIRSCALTKTCTPLQVAHCQ